MLKIFCSSLLLCSQILFAADLSIENREQNKIELFRVTLLNPQTLDLFVRNLSEMEIDSADKDADFEEIVHLVKEQVTTDAFIQKFISMYDDFSDEEIQWLFEVETSDTTAKLKSTSTQQFPNLMSELHQAVQKIIQLFPNGKKLSIATSDSLTSGLMMPITKEQFSKEVEESELPVIMDCYATSCFPCKKMVSIFTELCQERMNQVKFVNFNIETDPAFAQELKIRSLPTFLFFKGGKIVGRHVGALSKEALVEKMEKFIL